MRLQPANTIRRIAKDVWEATDDDPWFVAMGRFRRGRYRIRFRAQSVGEDSPTSMKVYFADAAGEFQEADALTLGRLPCDGEDDIVELTIDLPCDTRAVRFDPAETICQFRFSDFRMRRVPLILQAARTLRTVVSQFLKSPAGLISDVEKFLGKRTLAPIEAGLDRRHTVVVPSDLPQFVPLNLMPCDDFAPRLNVLIPGLTLRTMSGGPNTAVNLTYRLAQAGVPVRYISTDIGMEQDRRLLWDHFESLTGISEQLSNVELATAHDRGLSLAIGSRDVFLGTAWWTVQLIRRALPLMRIKRFLYLIQDFEPGLYAWSTSAALAQETYAMDFRAIICGELLAEHLCASRVGRFADPSFIDRCAPFEPAVDTEKFYPELTDPRSRKKRLLFYARPNAPRNLYELGLVALKRAVDRGAFSAAQWELWFMGENLPTADLGNGVAIRQYPWSDYMSYARLLRGADVGLSLMLSPHTSYPPLEMAACGATVVTNTYSVKTAERLREISENILPVEAQLDAITEGLIRAALRTPDVAARRAGAKLGVPGNWEDVFNPLIPKIIEMWHDCLDSEGRRRAAA